MLSLSCTTDYYYAAVFKSWIRIRICIEKNDWQVQFGFCYSTTTLPPTERCTLYQIIQPTTITA